MLDIEKAIKKNRKRTTLSMNRIQGAFAEQQFVIGESLRGYQVKRKAHGSDYEERKVDPLTGKLGKRRLVEVKSGRAKLSELQKKTRRKNKKNYRIVRI